MYRPLKLECFLLFMQIGLTCLCYGKWMGTLEGFLSFICFQIFGIINRIIDLEHQAVYYLLMKVKCVYCRKLTSDSKYSHNPQLYDNLMVFRDIQIDKRKREVYGGFDIISWYLYARRRVKETSYVRSYAPEFSFILMCHCLNQLAAVKVGIAHHDNNNNDFDWRLYPKLYATMIANYVYFGVEFKTSTDTINCTNKYISNDDTNSFAFNWMNVIKLIDYSLKYAKNGKRADIRVAIGNQSNSNINDNTNNSYCINSNHAISRSDVSDLDQIADDDQFELTTLQNRQLIDKYLYKCDTDSVPSCLIMINNFLMIYDSIKSIDRQSKQAQIVTNYNALNSRTKKLLFKYNDYCWDLLFGYSDKYSIKLRCSYTICMEFLTEFIFSMVVLSLNMSVDETTRSNHNYSYNYAYKNKSVKRNISINIATKFDKICLQIFKLFVNAKANEFSRYLLSTRRNEIRMPPKFWLYLLLHYFSKHWKLKSKKIININNTHGDAVLCANNHDHDLDSGDVLLMSATKMQQMGIYCGQQLFKTYWKELEISNQVMIICVLAYFYGHSRNISKYEKMLKQAQLLNKQMSTETPIPCNKQTEKLLVVINNLAEEWDQFNDNVASLSVDEKQRLKIKQLKKSMKKVYGHNNINSNLNMMILINDIVCVNKSCIHDIDYLMQKIHGIDSNRIDTQWNLIENICSLKECNWKNCKRKNVKLKACRQCLSVYYCSSKCQKKDWSEGEWPHRNSCTVLSKRDYTKKLKYVVRTCSWFYG